MNKNTLDNQHHRGAMLVLASAGIGIILFSKAAYMEVFSYPVVSRSAENGIMHVDIIYVDPLASFSPVLLVLGLVVSAYGFWLSRGLLSLHKRKIGIGLAIGSVLTLLSLVNVQHQLTSGPNDYYYYGFPLPWLMNIIIYLPFQRNLWVPTLWIPDDLLFWLGLAYLSLFLRERLGRLYSKSFDMRTQRVQDTSGTPPHVSISSYHPDTLE